ncbi:MAG: TetR/AcrR family transcriptional regulator [Aeromicrobium sp.]
MLASSGGHDDDDEERYENSHDAQNLDPARGQVPFTAWRFGHVFSIQIKSVLRDTMSRCTTLCQPSDMLYDRCVPRLWNETIEAHRRDVREAILQTTWRLVSERGVLNVTMGQIAEQSGIGRATLYKYFDNVSSILIAHHDRHVAIHLEQLAELRDRPGSPAERLQSVFKAYGSICHARVRHGSPDVIALVHTDSNVADADQAVVRLLTDIVGEAVEAGAVRDDIPPKELAQYAAHALAAAGSLTSRAAVERLVSVTLAGLASATHTRKA